MGKVGRTTHRSQSFALPVWHRTSTMDRGIRSDDVSSISPHPMTPAMGQEPDDWHWHWQGFFTTRHADCLNVGRLDTCGLLLQVSASHGIIPDGEAVIRSTEDFRPREALRGHMSVVELVLPLQRRGYLDLRLGSALSRGV